MIRTPRAILWDLDGTLIDSEPIHRQAILATLEEFGVGADRLDPRDFVGRGERDFWAFCKEQFALGPDVHALVDSKDHRYAQMVRTELSVMPGAVDCLERFMNSGMPMAIASGSSPRAIAAAVSAVGLGHYFREMVSSLDPAVPRSKPHPDVFLEAARRLSIAPGDCLVIEDAQWGVRAACAAGMRVVAIPNTWTRDHDFSGATRICSSLHELDLSAL